MLSISPRLSMQSRFVCWNSHHPHLALHRPDKNNPIFIGSVWCILISRPRLIHSLSMLLVVSVRVLMDFIESAWQVAASVKPNHLKQNFKLARLTRTRLFFGVAWKLKSSPMEWKMGWHGICLWHDMPRLLSFSRITPMLRHLTTPAVARQMVDAISHQMSVEGILNLQIFDDKSSACYFARGLGVVMTAFFSQMYLVYLRCWQ